MAHAAQGGTPGVAWLPGTQVRVLDSLRAPSPQPDQALQALHSASVQGVTQGQVGVGRLMVWDSSSTPGQAASQSPQPEVPSAQVRVRVCVSAVGQAGP